jgi:hypothetical protein
MPLKPLLMSRALEPDYPVEHSIRVEAVDRACADVEISVRSDRQTEERGRPAKSRRSPGVGGSPFRTDLARGCRLSKPFCQARRAWHLKRWRSWLA